MRVKYSRIFFFSTYKKEKNKEWEYRSIFTAKINWTFKFMSSALVRWSSLSIMQYNQSANRRDECFSSNHILFATWRDFFRPLCHCWASHWLAGGWKQKDGFAEWCEVNYLELNIAKTKDQRLWKLGSRFLLPPLSSSREQMLRRTLARGACNLLRRLCRTMLSYVLLQHGCKFVVEQQEDAPQHYEQSIPSHPVHPSLIGHHITYRNRLIVQRFRTDRYRRSFLPVAIRPYESSPFWYLKY